MLTLSALGAGIVYLTIMFAEQYEAVSRLGRPWMIGYLVLVTGGGLLFALGTGRIAWILWKRERLKHRKREQRARNPSQLSRAEKQQELQQNLDSIETLGQDAGGSADIQAELRPLQQRIQSKQETSKLEIVAFGTISSGKSALLNALAGRDVFRSEIQGGTTATRGEIPWPGSDQVVLVDTPGLGEVEGSERAALAAEAARDADLVLLVIDGPLRQSEFELLEVLLAMEKRVLVCLNKEDLLRPEDRDELLQQIAGQVRGSIAREDLLAVQANPSRRVRMVVSPDGSTCEQEVEVQADIGPLAQRMLEVVRRDGRDLLLANLLMQSRGLVDTAREKVQAALDRRAWEVVERYMWGAGGVAALSPFPLVDLASGVAISTKMVIDLARVYRHEMDLETASRLLAQLGKSLIANVGATAAAPAVAAAVASLLKTVPGAGTVAGGTLQGLVQAVVTRWIGAVFIEYFRSETSVSERGLAEIASRQWKSMTTVEQLRRMLRRATEDDVDA